MNIFNKIINTGDLCFDIGSNNGNKAESMLSLNAKVICLEPQSSCQERLHAKFKDNNSVTIIKKALGSKEGSGEIFISPAHTLSTMSKNFIEKTSKERFFGVNWNSTESVEITTLDVLIDTYGTPKFCKIDVEGYEKEVLKGLSKAIKYISIEFTPELKDSTFECIDILNKLGNYVYNYSEGESCEFTFSEWISSDEIIDFLSKNNDFKKSFGDLYAKLV